MPAFCLFFIPEVWPLCDYTIASSDCLTNIKRVPLTIIFLPSHPAFQLHSHSLTSSCGMHIFLWCCPWPLSDLPRSVHRSNPEEIKTKPNKFLTNELSDLAHCPSRWRPVQHLTKIIKQRVRKEESRSSYFGNNELLGLFIRNICLHH